MSREHSCVEHLVFNSWNHKTTWKFLKQSKRNKEKHTHTSSNELQHTRTGQQRVNKRTFRKKNWTVLLQTACVVFVLCDHCCLFVAANDRLRHFQWRRTSALCTMQWIVSMIDENRQHCVSSRRSSITELSILLHFYVGFRFDSFQLYCCCVWLNNNASGHCSCSLLSPLLSWCVSVCIDDLSVT